MDRGILGLVSLVSLIGVQRWMNSRTFIAVDMPSSLARGRIKAGPFKINLRSYYQVKINTGWAHCVDPNCPSYDRVKAHWVLYKAGHVVAKWLESTPYTHLGSFYSEKGTYELDWEVFSDTACLNPGQPRLLVYTDRRGYEDYATPTLYVSAFGRALGASLVVLGSFALSAEVHPRSTRISDSLSIGQNFQWAQTLPLKKTFSSLPPFALIAAPILLILIIVFALLEQPYPQRGLFVRTLKPELSTAADGPFDQPVVVQLVSAGPTVLPKVYVNSKPVPWSELSRDLKDELKVHAKWVVHVEADPDLPSYDVANAIDVAKGLQARVVLLTLKPDHTIGNSREAATSNRH